MTTSFGPVGRLHRRFHVTDILILIAAPCVALAVIRFFLPTSYSPSSIDQQYKHLQPPAMLSWVLVSQPLLMAWSAAWLVLQVRQPRIPMRRLVDRAGFRACLTPVLMILLAGPQDSGFIFSLAQGANTGMGFLQFMTWNEMLGIQIGIGVVVAWMPFLLTRRRWGGTSWLERGGQVIGLLWVLLIPANLLRLFWYNKWL